MQRCPHCGRYFKNKQALRAHLKHCPLKPKEEEMVVDKFTYRDYHFEVKGKKEFLNKEFYDILNGAIRYARKNGLDTLSCLVGAIYSLRQAGLIQAWNFKRKHQHPDQ